ncbi:uncharacterized protein BX663DRAFT_497836 [Cokeromyces recurvatus]|uniref:uncharacterized protein n=1 Tax=Cokeromyces recurvatus TaxID=90255 RepID=UPI00221FAF32|nr:uncharacterized protein BX663DRAFT_497836 [Cokeromyces recurvatus]KAI7905845.1 hypothetical protein BX663DRAFT_497836 [Cokeromyces recurvatus]
MDKRPKRSNVVEKNYRERKRQRRRNSEKSVSVSSTVDNTPPQYDLIEQLYNDILDYKDPDDEEYDLCALFLELPSKVEYPDYYDVIKHPIALEDMKAKIDAKEYTLLSQFKADIELMISNAKKYNIKESQVYEDAIKIQKFVKNWKEPKEKAILKLPGDAFTQGSTPKIKAIKLRAVDKQSQKTIKALMQAISKKDSKRALELLEEDKDLNPNELIEVEMFNDKFTWAPIHAAAYYGDVKLVESLLARGANVELNDTWYSATPLGWAAFGDKDKVVKLLIEKYNANIKAENIHGQVPFDVVSDQDDPRWIGLFKEVPPTLIPQKPPQPQPQPQPQASQPQPNPLIHLPAPPQTQTTQQTQIQIQQQQQEQQAPTINSTNASIPQINNRPQQIQITPNRPLPIQSYPPGTVRPIPTVTDGQFIKKRRGRPPKSETEAATARPTTEIDLNTFDPVAFEIELFNAIRTHTDNTNRLYSEQFEDLPDREEYPEYYNTIKKPVSLTMIAEKMQTRAYSNLHAWIADMRLVFENALNFNEPGSRIYRDAKLLLRLLNRLQDRILARLGVPVSQEDAAFRIDLRNRPFDVDALSEDKRKIKRYLNTNKSRTQSMEPEQHHAMPPYIMQQQQQQLLQQQLLFQQQQQQQQQQQRQFMSMQPSVDTPAMIIQPSLPQSFEMNTFVPNTIPNRPTPPLNTYGPFSGPTSNQSPLPKASKEFYALCQDEVKMFIQELKITSPNNNSIVMSLDGEYSNHSIFVPSNVETLTIQPDLVKALKVEEKRLNITVLQNNMKLNVPDMTEWHTASLTRGTNLIKISITANCTQPDSTIPEYKSKIYHLFVTRNW